MHLILRHGFWTNWKHLSHHILKIYLHPSSFCLDPHRIPTSRTLTTTEATRSQSTRGNRSSRTLQETFPCPSRTSWTAATWPVWRTTSKDWSHPGLVGKSLILWGRWRWDVFPDNFSFFGIFHVLAFSLTYQIRPMTNPRTVLRSKHETNAQQVKHSLKSTRGLVVLLQWSYHTSMFITGTNTSKIESQTTNYVFSTLSFRHFIFILYFQNWQILIKYQGPDRKSFVLEIMSAVKCLCVEEKQMMHEDVFNAVYLQCGREIRDWVIVCGGSRLLCRESPSSGAGGGGGGGGYTNWPPIHAIKGGVVCLLAK